MINSSKSHKHKPISRLDGIGISIRRKWHSLFSPMRTMSDWYQEMSSSLNLSLMAKLNGRAEVILSKLLKLRRFVLRSRILKELQRIQIVDILLNLFGNPLPLIE